MMHKQGKHTVYSSHIMTYRIHPVCQYRPVACTYLHTHSTAAKVETESCNWINVLSG